MTSGRIEIFRANISRVRGRMARAARKAGRSPEAACLLAVTKYVSADVVRDLYALGLRDFAENTVQRLAAKAGELSDLADIRWYMIGHLQRNKVSRSLRLVRGIHSVDSPRLLKEIAAQAGRQKLALPELYIEINVSEEPQKTGLPPGELFDLLRLAQGLRCPRGGAADSAMAGLMTMAPYGEHAEDSRPYFRRLRQMRDECVAAGLLSPGAGLSMGMSADFTVAIEEGATVIRVGSTLFEELDGDS